MSMLLQKLLRQVLEVMMKSTYSLAEVQRTYNLKPNTSLSFSICDASRLFTCLFIFVDYHFIFCISKLIFRFKNGKQRSENFMQFLDVILPLV